MALTHSPSVVLNGLIMHLDAANSKSYPGSGTAWYDLSGVGNHATLYNSPTFATTNGGLLNFDAVNDYAKVNNTGILPTTAYTKMAWFRPETGTSNNIISGGNNDHAFWMGSTSTTLQAGHNGSWAIVSYSPGNMLNRWWHGAVTFNTTTGWVLYLNGVQVATNSAVTPFGGPADVRISAYGDSSNLFDGDIPVAQVYNRVLTAAEVAQNFNAYRGRFGI